MTEQTRFDRVLPGLFDELADARTPTYLEAAIERASSRTQRPAWTYPGRWLPMEMTTDARPFVRAPFGLLVVLALVGMLLALAITAAVGPPREPTVSVPIVGPAGNGVIVLAKDGEIYVADRPGGELRLLVAGPGDDHDPMFSADGARLAFLRDSPAGLLAMVADPDGTNLEQIPMADWLRTSTWMLAPDGRSLMTLAVPDGVRRFDPEDQGKRVVIRPIDAAAPLTVLDIRLPGPWEFNEAPSFRPTNPREILVFAQLERGGPRGLYVYDLATRAIRTVVVGAPDMHVNNVRWFPDGEHITYNGRIVAADGSGNGSLAPQVLEADQLSALSNDGTRIVAWDNGYEAAAVVPVERGGPAVTLACGRGWPLGCPGSWAWSPDDSMLIGPVGDETARSYVLADPRTGQIAELDWVDVRTDGWGTPAWQRVAP